MVKPNRSVLRSKNMLRKAYIELSTEKDASKITVVDVVNRANLSRITFYAHYPDVNAIAEEIENEFIQKFNLYLDQTLFSQKLITRCRCSSASSSLS
ncbi:MAG: TetR/AcrR family transcriptional regulator [Clostridiales bacterium]|nr:TetR/AcrR family transcriptional regulator [Clostridiales bacterium]